MGVLFWLFKLMGVIKKSPVLSHLYNQFNQFNLNCKEKKQASTDTKTVECK